MSSYHRSNTEVLRLELLWVILISLSPPTSVSIHLPSSVSPSPLSSPRYVLMFFYHILSHGCLSLKCPPQASVFEHLIASGWCCLGDCGTFRRCGHQETHLEVWGPDSPIFLPVLLFLMHTGMSQKPCASIASAEYRVCHHTFRPHQTVSPQTMIQNKFSLKFSGFGSQQ